MKKILCFLLVLMLVVSCDDSTINDTFNSSVEVPEGIHQEDVFELLLSDSVMSALSNFRELALERKVISPDLKIELPAKVRFNKEEIIVSIRLKGDWTDHLKTDKWSYRIKVEEDKTIKGVKSFSIQSPETRKFLREFIVHKMFAKEKVLTTRYDFIPVAINGKYKGIYAFEEHFDKYLIENNQRREAPILKFNEEDLWKTRENGKGIDFPFPFYDDSRITLFKKNKTFKKPTLKSQFERARSLMLHLKENGPNIDKLVDIEAMAKYHAIGDVTGSYHSYIWHNRRFYYNPVLDRLEPIGFDCNPEIITEIPFKRTLYMVQASRSFGNYEMFTRNIANNPEFLRLYKKYVKKYSSDAYINELKSELNTDLDKWYNLLTKEYGEGKLEKMFLDENIPLVQNYIPTLDTIQFNYNTFDSKYKSYADTNVFFKQIALKGVKVNNLKDSTVDIHLQNFHLAKITCVGYALKVTKAKMVSFDKSFDLGRYNQGNPIKKINLPWGTDRIFYTVSNKPGKTYSCNLSSWQYFNSIEKPKLMAVSYAGLPFKENGDTLILEKGSYQIKSNVNIPSGVHLKINVGVQLNMMNQAAFISRSPIHFIGSKEEPINFTSSDSTSNGLVLLSNEEKSILNYVHFTNLRSMKQDGWILTGAVTIYQSDILISNCSFKNNNSEDALNLVRCKFEINNSIIDGTTSDAFDADFCEGTVSESTFLNSGNDAIDVSGSVVKVLNVKMKNIGDKAVSGGEKSSVSVVGLHVDGALTALASKDESTVIIEKSSITNTQTVFAAFKKKSEFGPASISIKSSTWTGFELEKIIGKGSTLMIDGNTETGTKVINVDSMYAQFAPK